MSQDAKRDGAWGAAAQDWAEVQEGTLRPLFDAVLAATAAGPGTTLLDVACGTGLFCALAAERGATVAGVDASEGQLAVSRARLPNAEWQEGEMESLPFAAGRFDLISCCNALQYATDPVLALREMRRVGRAGATVAILGRSRRGPHATQAYFTALEPFRPLTDLPPRSLIREPGGLESALGAAGLMIYEDAEVDSDWVYPDLETALRGALSFAPGVRAIRHSGAERVRASVGAALAAYQTPDGGYRIPNRMRYVLAREA